MCRNFYLIFLIAVISGCTLFRTPLREKLQPLQMTKIEGGTFLMGDVMERENDDSLPLHEVTLNDFYIGTYEVTYNQYDAFSKATGRPLPRDDERGRGERASDLRNLGGSTCIL